MSDYAKKQKIQLLDYTHSNVRGSFLILNRTPWSPKDRDRNVDSFMPGKLLDGYTAGYLLANIHKRRTMLWAHL